MPVISKKGVNMPASPIRKLVPYAEAAKERGTKIFHLNIGQPDIKTPQVALDAIKNYSEQVVEYSHSAGHISYRTALVDYYKSCGIELNADQIIVTCGGSEALSIALQSCLDEGDELIIPEPFYANYNGFSTSSGVTVVPVPSTIETGFALPPISEFEKRITAKTKGIMICNPGNPTGYLYSKEELEQLKEIVLKHDLFLFADEVYREFTYSEDSHTSILSIEGLEQHAIVVDSISKRYSACGVRIGNMATKNMEVINTGMKFAQARLSPPSLGQVLAEAATKTEKQYFVDVKTEYIKRRDFVVSSLQKMEGVVVPKPGGAFYVMAKLPVDNSEKFCQWMLEEFSYEGHTVMMAPGSGFYASPGKGTQEVRIAYVLNQESLDQAMKTLEAGIKEYNKQN